MSNKIRNNIFYITSLTWISKKKREKKTTEINFLRQASEDLQRLERRQQISIIVEPENKIFGQNNEQTKFNLSLKHRDFEYKIAKLVESQATTMLCIDQMAVFF